VTEGGFESIDRLVEDMIVGGLLIAGVLLALAIRLLLTGRAR